MRENEKLENIKQMPRVFARCAVAAQPETSAVQVQARAKNMQFGF